MEAKTVPGWTDAGWRINGKFKAGILLKSTMPVHNEEEADTGHSLDPPMRAGYKCRPVTAKLKPITATKTNKTNAEMYG